MYASVMHCARRETRRKDDCIKKNEKTIRELKRENAKLAKELNKRKYGEIL